MPALEFHSHICVRWQNVALRMPSHTGSSTQVSLLVAAPTDWLATWQRLRSVSVAQAAAEYDVHGRRHVIVHDDAVQSDAAVEHGHVQ